MELVLGHPFFGAMALRLALVQDPACADMWTDGVTLGYNPRALEPMTEPEVVTMLAHEILHLACEHHLRRGRRDEELWNRACDLAVNGLLSEAGFALPRGYPFDPAHAGRPAEAIYAALSGQREARSGNGSADRGEDGAAPADGAPGEGGTPFTGQAAAPRPASGESGLRGD
jgi:hypothetical protein